MYPKFTITHLGVFALVAFILALPLMLVLPAVLLWLLPSSGQSAATMWGCAVAGIASGGLTMYLVLTRVTFATGH
jgi:hypothetical protein